VLSTHVRFVNKVALSRAGVTSLNQRAAFGGESAIGDTLEAFVVAGGYLSAAELDRVKKASLATGEPLVTAIRSLGVMPGRDVARMIAAYYKLPIVTEDEWPKAAILGDALSPRYLREHKLLPLLADERRLVVAAADPGNTAAVEAIRLAAGRAIELRVAAADDIDAAIDRFKSVEDAQQKSSGGPVHAASDGDDDIEHLKDLALGAPVVQFVNQLLLNGMHMRATDIHIEPYRGRLAIRYRVDGMMMEGPASAAQMARAIVSRVKILSGLDIAERRLPQDGRASIRIEGRGLDVRVATMPTIHGESVAIRLLENARQVLSPAKLGIAARDETLLRKYLEAPHGLIIVTGPTGSGKTTTLAAALTILNEPHRKILTIEDPIEYPIEGINQAQANPDIGFGFANALRHFLRHDPDVIMVGEMRDAETARIAVHAALTGHLVLSTLHTNSAAGAVTRLLDMGVDGYLMASCLTCVIGQRLVRVLCTNCREHIVAPIDFPPEVLQRAGLTDEVAHWRARGCERCNGIGYAGRTSIVEVLEMNEEIRQLTRPSVATWQVEEAAARAGMRTMAIDGLQKCCAGITTPEEVRRVTFALNG
jgi:general secretion pathway protein E